jgi:hypothetical protein
MNGGTETAKLYSNQSSISLPDAKLTERFQYRSVYLPEPGAIDTVYLDWITAEEYPKTSLWIAGNGTPAEWNSNDQIEMPFDENNPWVYVCETDLKSNGGEIKILVEKGNWDGKNIRPLVSDGSILDTKMQLYPGGADLKWKVAGGQDGQYRITADLNKMEIQFVKL